MSTFFLLIGGLSAFVSVAAGAFGAHALKQKLSMDLLNAFEVGVRYQMYHALALIMLGILWKVQGMNSIWLTASGWSLIVGSLLFSGSLYALALTGVRALGMITPIGGVAFLLGWLFFLIAVVKLA